DILAPEYKAVILPSSQSRNVQHRVENVCDGKPETFYESAPNERRSWLEIRWPQPVSIESVQAKYTDEEHSTDYMSANGPGAHGASLMGMEMDASGTLKVTQKAKVSSLRLSFGQTKSGVLQISELKVIGTAHPYTLKSPDWKGDYIWYPEPDVSNATRYFRRTFEIPSVARIKTAFMQISTDDVFFLHVNGNYVGTGGIPTCSYNLKPLLRDGTNLLAIKAQEFGGGEGVLFELTLIDDANNITRIISDSSVLASQTEVAGWEKDLKIDGFVPARASGRAKTGVAFNYIGSGVEPLRVSKVDGSKSVGVGEYLKLSFTLQTEKTLDSDFGFRAIIGDVGKGQNCDYSVATLELRPEVPTSQWKTGEEYCIEGDFHIPWWAPDGVLPVRLEAISESAILNPIMPKSFKGIDIRKFEKRRPLKSRVSKAEIRTVKDGAKLFVNGKMVCPFVMTEASDPDTLNTSGWQAHSGAEIQRLMFGADFWSPNPETRKVQLQKSLDILDQRMDFLLRQNQNAYVIVGLTITPTAEWSSAYKDDATILPNGYSLRHSFSSQKFIEEGERGLRDVIAHIMKSKYAGHVIGFHFGIGEGPETYYWGASINGANTKREELIFGDFSPVAVAAFRKWLRERYRGDIEALRTAWKRPEATFENLKPEIDELRRKDFASFRDPANGRMAMDFWEFQADAVANCASRFAKTIKEASRGNWICGLWGFYNVAMNHCTGTIGKGHHIAYNAVEKILHDKNIDYIAAIQCYAGVNEGTPVVSIFAYDSLRRHGKLFLEEYDIRTFFTDLTYAAGHLYSERENHAIIKRDFGKSIAHDHACWWVGFPIGHKGRLSVGWYAEEGLLRLLEYCHTVRKATYKYPCKSIAEVGLFFEDRDIATMDVMNGDPILASLQFNTIFKELSHMGVPFDMNSLSDLNEKSAKQYKVVIVVDAFYLTAEQRERIDRAVKRDGKTVVWLYAPAIIDREKGLDAALVSQMTGFGLNARDGELPQGALTVNLSSDIPAFASINDASITPRSYEYDPRTIVLGPTFEIADEKAAILGSYAKDGKPAVGVKKFDDWTSVYCALPCLNAPLLSGISRRLASTVTQQKTHSRKSATGSSQYTPPQRVTTAKSDCRRRPWCMMYSIARQWERSLLSSLRCCRSTHSSSSSARRRRSRRWTRN
ncbi:MAG: beta-galactosidase, partial [Victivallales bacterium]|nr:beta-galactosidase [Victivallales bacterium]